MNDKHFQVSGNVVDIPNRRIYPADVVVDQGIIISITETRKSPPRYLVPGFVDSHVHIESSMLVPSQFARTAVKHGTVATVSDVHEIANVLGMAGVRYMLDEAREVPFKFYFGAPSCVPATDFETAGARISSGEIAELMADPKILYLSEMMNYPGVISRLPEVMAKLKAASDRGKPIDGHAPGLTGEDARRYFGEGITTDHECSRREEALEKIRLGVKILIREGSAARNFEALFRLMDEFPQSCMLCSDDKHPDELLNGHINQLVSRAVSNGIDEFKALTCACINPVEHYRLDVGLLREGDAADFIEVDDLVDFKVTRTFIGGRVVYSGGESRIETQPATVVNCFEAQEISEEQLRIPATSNRMNVIQVTDGQLLTTHIVVDPTVCDGHVVGDASRDLLKLVVLNRYRDAQPAIAFIRGFGLKQGALASSVAHDSHNVIAVGVSDRDIRKAINSVVRTKGGLAMATDDRADLLPLPVAGLMSIDSCEKVAADYLKMDGLAKEWGTTLRSPFTTLSFMALLVIPEYKLSDRGLFDGRNFEFAPLFVT